MAESIHPVARILLWCGWAVAVEHTDLPTLFILAVVTATAFLFPRVRSESARLLRRIRWLIAVLVMTYAYTVPGTLLWPDLGWASPGVNGIELGVLRAGRLGLMVIGLAALLAYTSRPRLIYALYVLALPFTWLGLDRRAFAVRLGLTLEYVENAPPAGRWMETLRTPLPDDPSQDTYILHAERWQVSDSAVILAGLLGVWMLLA